MARRSLSAFLLGLVLISWLPAFPAEAVGGSAASSHTWSGTGAWRIVFHVDADNDLTGNFYAADMAGPSFGTGPGSQSTEMLAVLRDRAFVFGYASPGAYGATGHVTYASINGETVEQGPLFADGGIGEENWHGFNGRNASRTVEIIFLHAAPSATLIVNASWTRGVTGWEEGPLDAIAWRASDFPEGVTAGSQFVASATVGLRGTLSSTHGLLGWFGVRETPGVTRTSCSSPGDPNGCHTAGLPSGMFLDETPGSWEFEVDVDARAIDPREHVLLAVWLPGS